MATAISQNLRRHCISRSLFSNYCLFSRYSTTSASASTPATCNPQLPISPNQPLDVHHIRSGLFAPLGFRCGDGVVSFSALNRRFYSSGTANQTSSSDASSKTSSDSGSGESSSDGSKKTGEQGKSIRGSPVSWMSFLLLIATGAALVWYYDREKKKHIAGINSASQTVKQGPSAGKAAIGGPFNLVDHDGKSVTDKDFLGKWTLMYFGFTHCPDICPDELQKVAAAVDKIKEKSGIQVVPVFISVDPERDTVEQVREYVKEFHPNLIGLTGTVEEVKKTARAYRVYYMKTEEEGSDYLVDHSIVTYLMDPQMEFVKFFGKNNDADTLSDGVIQEIKQRK